MTNDPLISPLEREFIWIHMSHEPFLSHSESRGWSISHKSGWSILMDHPLISPLEREFIWIHIGHDSFMSPSERPFIWINMSHDPFISQLDTPYSNGCAWIITRPYRYQRPFIWIHMSHGPFTSPSEDYFYGSTRESRTVHIAIRDYSYESIWVMAHSHHHQKTTFMDPHESHEPFISLLETIHMNPYESWPIHITIGETKFTDPH